MKASRVCSKCDKGLSGYIKQDVSKNDIAGQYLMSGSLESYKIPSLLFQVMLSIGFNGDIVPNNQGWCRLHNINMNINPTSVIVKAASMVLELILFFKVTSITDSNLIKLKLHALLHAADQIRSHGVPITTDVQMLEEHH